MKLYKYTGQKHRVGVYAVMGQNNNKATKIAKFIYFVIVKSF